MPVTNKVEVISAIPEATRAAEFAAESLVEALALGITSYAKKNVAPGVGPGPHPHRVGSKHIDYGKLRDDIKQTEAKKTNEGWESDVITTLMYGLYLELGWMTKKRHVVRYTWLIPAAVLVWNKDAKRVLENVSKHYFPESNVSIEGMIGVNLKNKRRLTGTWQLRKSYHEYKR